VDNFFENVVVGTLFKIRMSSFLVIKMFVFRIIVYLKNPFSLWGTSKSSTKNLKNLKILSLGIFKNLKNPTALLKEKGGRGEHTL